MFTIIDRYILQLLIGPFVISSSAFTSITLSVGVLFELVRRVVEGLPFKIAGKILLYKSPYFIFLSFPLASLFATLITFNQLANNKELIGFRSLGISNYKWLRSTIIFGTLIAISSFFINDLIVPVSNHRANELLRESKENKSLENRRFDILYKEYYKDSEQGLKQIFYSQSFDGHFMNNVLVINFYKKKPEMIISSDKAVWDEKVKNWIFYSGNIYHLTPKGYYRSIMHFECYENKELEISKKPLQLSLQKRSIDVMNLDEAITYRNLLLETNNIKEARKVNVRTEQRYAIPFSCIILSLIGCILGSQMEETSKQIAFSISVFIILNYYIIAFITDALAQLLIINAKIGAWFPNIFCSIILCILFLFFE
jgi:lipopolysaccharide export system permease protein